MRYINVWNDIASKQKHECNQLEKNSTIKKMILKERRLQPSH